MPPFFSSSHSKNPSLFLQILSRFLSNTIAQTPTLKPPKLKNIRKNLRRPAIAVARSAIADYLHSTRSLPFSHAELIASLSPFSLSSFLSSVPIPATLPSSSHLSRLLRTHLSFQPLDEFDFFFESIGLNNNPKSCKSLFLADDGQLLSGVSALSHFGFPWNMLGLIYSSGALHVPPDVLVSRLDALENVMRPLPRYCVIGVCLAFPNVLMRDLDDEGGDVKLLLRDLRIAFLEFGVEGAKQGNCVEVYLEICRRVKVFYEAGSKVGELGELMGRNHMVFLEVEEAVIKQKLEFFVKLGMRREEVGRFVLGNIEVFKVDLVSPVISMPEYLGRVGLGNEEIEHVAKGYPYVMGKSKLGNLPAMLRAVSLTDWFLAKIFDDGDHLQYLRSDFVLADACHDEEIEKEFLERMEKVKCGRNQKLIDNKLESVLTLGFSKNKYTARVVDKLHSSGDQLQDRFDCLLELGIEYQMLCKMINVFPMVLNQGKGMLQEKVKFLTNDLGYSLDYFDNFPSFLCFDLENRMRPRYRMLNWLQELGLLKKPFAPGTVLSNSQKKFMISLYNVHPAAPKQWLECFSSRNHEYYHKKCFL